MDTHALFDWFYRFLLTETALHSGCPCIGLSPPKMCRTSLSSLGGGGPMKGFIFKSMRWYRMHEAVEINLFIIWSKTVRLKTAAFYVWVAILRLLIIMDFLICVLPDLCMMFHYFLWPIGIMIFFNSGCPFVSGWTCAPSLIGFIVFSFIVNFDVKRGLGWMWKMIIEFVHWDCYIVFLMIRYKLKTRFFLPFVV